MCLSLAIISCVAVTAKDNGKEQKAFEEAYARNIEPASKIYVSPQVVDLQYLSTERETYGPYAFPIKGLSAVTEGDLDNLKNRALYKAMIVEAGADIMVGAIFDSYVLENDGNTMWIEISAYPAKFVNFRNLGDKDNDYEMVRTVYPSAVDAYGKQVEQLQITGATNK